MSLVIDLPTSIEAQIETEARNAGVSPKEYVQSLIVRSVIPASDDLDAKLRRWQERDGKILLPDQSAASLFAQWDAQAVRQNKAERESEDRLWREVLQGIFPNV